MKKKSSSYLYICNNCDHEFYSKRKTRDDELIDCPRCGETAAYMERDSFDYNDEHDDNFYDYDEEYIDQDDYDSSFFPDDI